MITDGMVYSFGILYTELKEIYGASTSAAAFVISVQTSVTNLSGKHSSGGSILLELK